MRAHFINDKDVTAVYFPDTFKFYEINDFTKMVIEKLLNGERAEDIKRKMDIDDKKIYPLLRLLVENNYSINETSTSNEKVLDKLVLNITNKCNLACKYCYAGGGNYCSEESIMDDELCIKILDRFYKKYTHIKAIQLFGGEPALNLNSIERVCKYLDDNYKKGIIKEKPSIGMVTNGTIVNDKLVDLINSYGLKVTVSLDGPSTVNDKMRVFKNGDGTTNKVVENIKFLKSKTCEPSTIESTYNAHHVDKNIKVIDIINFMDKELNIDNLHIVPVSGNENSEFVLKDRSPFIDSVDDIFDSIKAGNHSSYSLVNKVIRALNKKVISKSLCQAGISVLSVSTKGDVYPCFMLTDIEDQRLGNVNDEDLFNSSLFIEKTNALKEFSKFEAEKCKDCFNNTICTGCLGINYIETKNVHNASKISCDMYRKITEKVICGIIRNNRA